MFYLYFVCLCLCACVFVCLADHRLRPEIFRILFAPAWHTEWSLLLHDAIGDWTILLQRRLPMLLNGPDNPRKLILPLGDLHPI